MAKTAEDIFKALKKNSYIESVNLNKVKITSKALKYLAEALKKNTTLTTLIINNANLSSEAFLGVVKALESENTTLHTLHIFQGPTKYFDSSLEKALKDRLCDNKTLMKVHIAPIRSTDVRNAVDKLPKDNQSNKKAAVGDDDWDNYNFDYDENDNYEYVYDPDWGKESEVPQEIGSLAGNLS